MWTPSAKLFVLSESEPGAHSGSEPGVGDTGSEARLRVECRSDVSLVNLVLPANAVMPRVFEPLVGPVDTALLQYMHAVRPIVEVLSPFPKAACRGNTAGRWQRRSSKHTRWYTAPRIVPAAARRSSRAAGRTACRPNCSGRVAGALWLASRRRRLLPLVLGFLLSPVVGSIGVVGRDDREDEVGSGESGGHVQVGSEDVGQEVNEAAVGTSGATVAITKGSQRREQQTTEVRAKKEPAKT